MTAWMMTQPCLRSARVNPSGGNSSIAGAVQFFTTSSSMARMCRLVGFIWPGIIVGIQWYGNQSPLSANTRSLDCRRSFDLASKDTG